MELGLKEQLMKIIYNDYELPKGYNLSEISENMLSNIGAIGDLTFPKTDLKYHNRIINIKSFLRSLYFRMIKEEGLKHFLIEVEKTLDKISRYD